MRNVAFKNENTPTDSRVPEECPTDALARRLARSAVARALAHFDGHEALIGGGCSDLSAFTVAMFLVEEVEALGYLDEWPRNFHAALTIALPVNHDYPFDSIDPLDVDSLAEDISIHRCLTRARAARASGTFAIGAAS